MSRRTVLLRGHGRSVALLVFGLIVVALVVVPVSLMWGRVHPPLVPLDDDPARHGLAHEDVSFASPLDGTPLQGWYIRSPRPTGRVLIVVPGIDDNRLAGGTTLPLATELVADGWDVLAFDLRAQGESGGDTLSFGAREQHDVLGAVAVARARGARHIAVLGFSMGASSALLAAARTPDIEALVLDSAFARWEETLRAELREDWHVPDPLVDYAVFLYEVLSGTDAGSVAPIEAIDRVAPRPMLFIAGAEDRTVSPADGAELAAAAGPAAEYVLVPGAVHVGAYGVDPAAYAARLRAFLAAVPPEPSRAAAPSSATRPGPRSASSNARIVGTVDAAHPRPARERGVPFGPMPSGASRIVVTPVGGLEARATNRPPGPCRATGETDSRDSGGTAK